MRLFGVVLSHHVLSIHLTAAYVHDIMSVWSLELLDRVKAVVKRTGTLGKSNYAIMGGMLSRLKLCVNCPSLLDLYELDLYHRRLQQRDYRAEAAVGEGNVEVGSSQLPGALGLEDGINILSAAEAERHFVVSLAAGAGYNRAGMQVLLNMGIVSPSSGSSSSCREESLQLPGQEGAACASGEEVLACPVCLDEGLSVERPVFLPCLHALCRDCALDLLEATGEAAGSRNECLFCPYNCNTEGIGGAGLRRGFNRASLVEVVRAFRPPVLEEQEQEQERHTEELEQEQEHVQEQEQGHEGDVERRAHDGDPFLQLSPSRCLSSWVTLEATPPPSVEVLADSIQPSADFPCLPAMMLAHFRTLSAEQFLPSTKLKWLNSLIENVLQEDITSKILVLVENNAVVEGISASLEAETRPLAFARKARKGTKKGQEEEGELWGGKSFVRVDSTSSQGHRAHQLSLFTDDPAIAVCVATRSIAGVGLNLTVANVVVLFNPAPTPGEESQAVNRVLRLGQTRAVRVYRVYVKQSVEERQLIWRKLKGELDSNQLDSSSFSVQSSMGGADTTEDIWGEGNAPVAGSGGGGAAAATLKEWQGDLYGFFLCFIISFHVHMFVQLFSGPCERLDSGIPYGSYST